MAIHSSNKTNVIISDVSELLLFLFWTLQQHDPTFPELDRNTRFVVFRVIFDNINAVGLPDRSRVMPESTDDSKCPIRVAVRIRPQHAKESGKVVHAQGSRVMLELAAKHGGTRTFAMDSVFGGYATQDEIFESLAAPVVEEVLQGFNSTIFAYGQTGSGKTHTLFGARDDPEEAGIIPRTVGKIYERTSGLDAAIRVSCLEIYNEELGDLLSGEETGSRRPSTAPSQRTSTLRLVDAADGTVQVKDLEEVLCATREACFAAIGRGARGRRQAATLCNERSSRSHCVVTLKVCVRTLADDGRELVTNGQMNLVDLAGSECVGRSGARNQRAREAGQINQSLLTLGRVITTLTSSGESKYVPYRDSKLTRLLKDSLGGGTKTTLIATVSPCRDSADETMSTLQYAQRARSILNAPTQHSQLYGTAVLKGISTEVDELARLLRMQRDKNGGILIPNEKYDDMVATLESNKRDLVELKDALDIKTKDLKALKDDKKFLESQLAEMTRHRDDLDEKLKFERMDHKATRHVEKELRSQEALLLNDAEGLKATTGSMLGDLTSVFTELGKRIADLENDSNSLNNLADVDVKAHCTKIRDAVSHLAGSIMETFITNTGKNQDDLREAASNAATSFEETAMGTSGRFAGKLKTDAEDRVTKAKTFGEALLKTSEAAATKIQSASTTVTEATTSAQAFDVKVTKDIGKTRSDVLNAVDVLAEKKLRCTTDLDSRHLDIAGDLEEAQNLDAATVAKHESFDSEEAKIFGDFEAVQTQWIEDVRSKLAALITSEFSSALQQLEHCSQQRERAKAAKASDVQALDTKRKQQFRELTEKKTSLHTSTTAALEDLEATKTDFQTAVTSLPALAKDIDDMSRQRAAQATSLKTILEDTVSMTTTEVRAMASQCNDDALATRRDADEFSAKESQTLQQHLAETKSTLQSALAVATENQDAEASALRRAVNDEATTINTATDAALLDVRTAADHLSSRPRDVPAVDLIKHRNDLDAVVFHPTKPRETLVADFYATHAAEASSSSVSQETTTTTEQQQQNTDECSPLLPPPPPVLNKKSTSDVSPLTDASNRSTPESSECE